MKIINICTRTPHWNGCGMCDKLYDENAFEFCKYGKLCHSQNSKHKCIGIERIVESENEVKRNV